MAQEVRDAMKRDEHAAAHTCRTVMGEQLLRRGVKRFRGGLVFKAYSRVYHSTLGWRVVKKKKRMGEPIGLRKQTHAEFHPVGYLN